VPDIYLYAGEASATDIRLSDPTILRSGAGTIDGTIAASQGQSAVLAMERLLDSTLISSQGQTASLDMERLLDSTLISSQGQTASLDMERALDGVLDASQGQSMVGECSVSTVVIHLRHIAPIMRARRRNKKRRK